MNNPQKLEMLRDSLKLQYPDYNIHAFIYLNQTTNNNPDRLNITAVDPHNNDFLVFGNMQEIDSTKYQTQISGIRTFWNNNTKEILFTIGAVSVIEGIQFN